MQSTALEQLLGKGGSTALMVLRHGSPILAWGDVALRSSVASVRKSIISTLFGIAFAKGQVRLQATLDELGIDDREPLHAFEKRATVQDLLRARSGVYHPAVYDTPVGRPARGAHPPGSFWFYNNWDFNVLGTVFRQVSGLDIFQALHDQIAVPLGMQDFRVDDGFLLGGPESVHPVYKLRMSARDLARFGQLYLQEGCWKDRPVVPAEWVRASTCPHSDLGGGRGYGYLWWTATAGAPGDAIHAPSPLFYASGQGGQYVIVVPALDLVVVHRAAAVDWGISHARMGEILQAVLAGLS